MVSQFRRLIQLLSVVLAAACTSATSSSASNHVELTSLVNLFIGTETGAGGGSGGNAFPGAAIPHAMAKVGTHFTSFQIIHLFMLLFRLV